MASNQLPALKESLRRMFQRVCERLGDGDVPDRRWKRFVRTGSGHAEMTIEVRKDYAAFVQRVTEAILPEFREVTEFVQANENLAMALLVEPASDDERPYRIFRELVVPLLLAYFARVQGVRFDERIFDDIFHVLVTELQTERVPLMWLSALTNVRLASDSIWLDERLRLRPVSREDTERWLNDSRPPVAFDPMWFESAVEEAWFHPVHQPVPTGASDRARRAVTALRLLSEADVQCGIAFTEHLSESLLWRNWLGVGGFGFTAATPILHLGPTLELNEATGVELKKIWTRLEASPNAIRVELPISRWHDAAERVRDEDKLIDYWIALESLFTSDSREEIQYRASMRIAAFLGTTAEERLAIRGGVRKSYGIRSKIVHGQKVKPATLREVTLWTRAHLRRSLLKILESNQPFDSRLIDDQLLEM